MTVYNPNQGGGISNLIVTDGVTTVNPTSEITFVGATVTDLGGGNAEVTITGGGGSQTPWTSDIDGASHSLYKVKEVLTNGSKTLTYTAGKLTGVSTAFGSSKVLSYNSNGTLNTVVATLGATTITKTMGYVGGVLTTVTSS